MEKTVAERALDALHDYAIWLRERGDMTDFLARTREERTKPEPPMSKAAQKSTAAAEVAATVWENGRLRKWRTCGRLTSGGLLRVRTRRR